MTGHDAEQKAKELFESGVHPSSVEVVRSEANKNKGFFETEVSREEAKGIYDSYYSNKGRWEREQEEKELYDRMLEYERARAEEYEWEQLKRKRVRRSEELGLLSDESTVRQYGSYIEFDTLLHDKNIVAHADKIISYYKTDCMKFLYDHFTQIPLNIQHWIEDSRKRLYIFLKYGDVMTKYRMAPNRTESGTFYTINRNYCGNEYNSEVEEIAKVVMREQYFLACRYARSQGISGKIQMDDIFAYWAKLLDKGLRECILQHVFMSYAGGDLHRGKKFYDYVNGISDFNEAEVHILIFLDCFYIHVKNIIKKEIGTFDEILKNGDMSYTTEELGERHREEEYPKLFHLLKMK